MITDVLLDALAVLLPVACAGCGRDDRTLCDACRVLLEAGRHRRMLADGTSVVAALRYDGAVRRVVLAFKEEGRTDVARALATPLATAIGVAATGTVQLVAMPVGREAYRRRGYDPVRLMLRKGGFGPPVAALLDVRRRDEQKALGRQARAANLEGTMTARGDLRGGRFLLVDDVVTTGATLLEAARAIRDGGGEVVGAAVLAATPRLFDDSHRALGQNRDFPSRRV